MTPNLTLKYALLALAVLAVSSTAYSLGRYVSECQWREDRYPLFPHHEEGFYE